MEHAVRHPVSAIRADTYGEATGGTGKYQSDGYPGARTRNVTIFPHLQSGSDWCAHGAGNRVPRALGLRTASSSAHDRGKEAHAEPVGDTDHSKGQTDACCAENLHFCRIHDNADGLTSK